MPASPAPYRVLLTDRAWPDDGNGLTRDVRPGHVQPIQTCASRRHEDRVLPGHVVWHAVQRVDVVDRVFRKSPVCGQATGAMAFGYVAVVQTRRVHAEYAVLAAAAALVRLDGDAVPDRQLVHFSISS